MLTVDKKGYDDGYNIKGDNENNHDWYNYDDDFDDYDVNEYDMMTMMMIIMIMIMIIWPLTIVSPSP